jgi:endonuclease G
MTRREDPIWGNPKEAALGNVDSMHVTNTVPQMQPFNAGIWLALESYALEHARQDRMRISVFTGPFFAADDPVREGVRIPRSFWKVIAFIHDETRKLCATGYTMSQEDYLRNEEFVFGRHKTAQTRIADIERRAGLSFGRLAARDPFDGAEEGVGGLLTDPSQIRFVSRRM